MFVNFEMYSCYRIPLDPLSPYPFKYGPVKNNWSRISLRPLWLYFPSNRISLYPLGTKYLNTFIYLFVYYWFLIWFVRLKGLKMWKRQKMSGKSSRNYRPCRNFAERSIKCLESPFWWWQDPVHCSESG